MTSQFLEEELGISLHNPLLYKSLFSVTRGLSHYQYCTFLLICCLFQYGFINNLTNPVCS